MNKLAVKEQEIISLYKKCKNKYKVARDLGLNKSYVSSLIDRSFPNNESLNKELEEAILKSIKIFPFTGTKSKIAKFLKVSSHLVNQVIIKTKNKNIKEYFNKPKVQCNKLKDKDIQDILDGSKLGIGNDLMGIKKKVDGTTIRNIRKKLLTKEEYEKYHSIDRFYSGDYNAFYNDRGDKFLSTWEEKVADYLFKNNIKYYSNVRLHYEDKNYSPDFYLPDSRVFIEVFGLSNFNHYIPNMNKKVKYYKKFNIKYLGLIEKHFNPILNFEDDLNNFLEEVKGKIFNKFIKEEDIIINKIK